MNCYVTATVLSVYDVFNENHTVQLPELFIVIQHYVLSDVFDIKFLSFLSNLLSMENDLLTGVEVGWAFCNSA